MEKIEKPYFLFFHGYIILSKQPWHLRDQGKLGWRPSVLKMFICKYVQKTQVVQLLKYNFRGSLLLFLGSKSANYHSGWAHFQCCDHVKELVEERKYFP